MRGQPRVEASVSRSALRASSRQSRWLSCGAAPSSSPFANAHRFALPPPRTSRRDHARAHVRTAHEFGRLAHAHHLDLLGRPHGSHHHLRNLVGCMMRLPAMPLLRCRWRWSEPAGAASPRDAYESADAIRPARSGPQSAAQFARSLPSSRSGAGVRYWQERIRIVRDARAPARSSAGWSRPDWSCGAASEIQRDQREQRAHFDRRRGDRHSSIIAPAIPRRSSAPA